MFMTISFIVFPCRKLEIEFKYKTFTSDSFSYFHRIKSLNYRGFQGKIVGFNLILHATVIEIQQTEFCERESMRDRGLRTV